MLEADDTSDEIAADAETKSMHNKSIADPVDVQALMANVLPLTA